jgi:hypothetical protein
MKKEQIKKQECINPTCGRMPIHRGLCVSCYQTALRLVKEEKTTWQKLEDSGKCEKVKYRRGVVISNWLLSK